jgi:hypothetical protein
MTTLINASTSSGLVQTADTSGIIKVQSNGVTTNALAWVRFNGVTTVTINASFNISSVTRSSAGVYVITFTNNLADANYVITGTGSYPGSANAWLAPNSATTTSTFTITLYTSTSTVTDGSVVSVAIFGN